MLLQQNFIFKRVTDRFLGVRYDHILPNHAEVHELGV